MSRVIYRIFPSLTIVLSLFLAILPLFHHVFLPLLPVTVFSCWLFYSPNISSTISPNISPKISMWFIVPFALFMEVVILMPTGFLLVLFLFNRLIIPYAMQHLYKEHFPTLWIGFIVTCACTHIISWSMLHLYHTSGMVVMPLLFSFIVHSMMFPCLLWSLGRTDTYLLNATHTS